MRTALSRREFLEAAAAAGIAAAGVPSVPAVGADANPACLEGGKSGGAVTRIRKIYLAKPVPTWPKPNLDVSAEMRRIDGILAGMAERFDGIRFEGGDLFRAMDGSDVPESAAALGNPDGLLVFNLTSTVGASLRRLAALGPPTVLFSQPYSGHEWSAVAGLQAAGHRILCLATSDFGEIPGACRLVRTIHRLRNTRIIHISNGPFNADRAARIRERFGATVVSVLPDRVNAAYKAVSEDAAVAEMHEWKSGAERVVEPSDRTIADAGRLYLALRRIMDEEHAQAVTIDCLALFAAKVLPAYPCLAFAKLNDLGLTGVCEADMDSTLTQLILTYAFGVPGFVSDPVIDTSNNTVIHAHCVSATRMDGPSGPRAPYIIRSHLEDDKGASLQVRMRIGQVITTAKLVNLDTMLISTGTITDTPDVDRGCRTKITTKVADARKVLRHYSGGLHRVIAYGDRTAAIEDLATLMGLNVVREC